MMSAGTNAALAETLHRNLSLSHVLDELVPSFTAALQSYQIRAGQRGQSFKHMVLLEAAVQGWCVPSLPPMFLHAFNVCACSCRQV